MKLSDFDYTLPKELIAQHPLRKRDGSRLMVVSAQKIEHKKFTDLPKYFKKGDVLVLNNSKVFPAKLIGKKETGGRVEVLLITQIDGCTWECLAQGKKLAGKKIWFGKISASLAKKNSTSIITFSEDIRPHLRAIGTAPLPPYIKKSASLSRYNTVFSKIDGSIAAPTAGLHFTKELMQALKKKGVGICYVTLHVGLGTFLPVKTENITGHIMHREWYSISNETAQIVNCRTGRLFVVGTTTLRALESASDGGKVIPRVGQTSIFIYPPYQWKLNYAGLITNFHLPKSTLLMLASAFLSRKKILEAYKTAIDKKYRFFSFGDAMMVVK